MYGLCSPCGFRRLRRLPHKYQVDVKAARLLRSLPGYYEGCKANVNATRLLRRLPDYCEGCQDTVKAARLLRRLPGYCEGCQAVAKVASYCEGYQATTKEAVTHVMRRSWVAVMEIMPIDQVLFDQLSSSHVHRALYRVFDGAFEEKAGGFDKAFYGEKAGGFDRAFYGAFEEKAGASRRRSGSFSELNRGRKRRLHPLREYIITLYTNGKLRTRVTVTLISGAEGT
ncbi:hypothetical protein Tco_0709028 [Tanacetum coccineum]